MRNSKGSAFHSGLKEDGCTLKKILPLPWISFSNKRSVHLPVYQMSLSRAMKVFNASCDLSKENISPSCSQTLTLHIMSRFGDEKSDHATSGPTLWTSLYSSTRLFRVPTGSSKRSSPTGPRRTGARPTSEERRKEECNTQILKLVPE